MTTEHQIIERMRGIATDPAAREAYERATHALGAAYMQQIRFPDASTVTREAIDLLGDDLADP